MRLGSHERVVNLCASSAQLVERLIFGDPVEPQFERLLEPEVLVQVCVVEGSSWIDVAVKDLPANALRKKCAVCLTEVGAVGKSIKIYFANAESLSNRIHVSSAVDGSHVRKQLAIFLLAVSGVVACSLEPGISIFYGNR